MKKILPITLFLIAISLLLSIAGTAQTTQQKHVAKDHSEVKELLSKTFPKLQVTGVNKTDVTGLYEIEVGSNVVYFYPDKSLMIFGEIWTKEGNSLTAQSRARIATSKVKDIPLAKGLKIGDGKNIVVEFTDPDCPYCRKASQFLRGRKDTTRYVFFAPMPYHKDAESKVKYIMCSDNKAQVYEEVMSGKYDGQKLEICNSNQVSALVEEHKQIAQTIGISATPSFWINGQSVNGANIPVMEQLLTKIN